MKTEELILCPKCGFRQHENTECIKCGIVFAKFDPERHRPFPVRAQENIDTLPEEEHDEASGDRWLFRSGKFALVGLMGFFFFYMVIQKSGWCFLDYVNLPFHEFGHILFTPFGETMHFLGGTLFQLLLPFSFACYFLYRKEYLSSSFCLFWFGENFLNISKYMADARDLRLPLVGGGTHDWNFLFYKWGVIHLDKSIAWVMFSLGVLIMTGTIVWAAIAPPRAPRESLPRYED